MAIHFIHFGNANLPELQAYDTYLQSIGQRAYIHRDPKALPTDAPVLWIFCGNVSRELARRYPAAVHIHEYASASVPPMASFKDKIKRWSHPTPNYRVFQNAWVHQRLGFDHSVPFEYRDMGVASCFFDQYDAEHVQEFDFVYLGEMQRLKHFLGVFDALATLGRRVLLIGLIPDDLKQRFLTYANLTVIGQIPHADVPAQLRRARYGLNLVPVQLPYSRQTSTKLIEYCAAGLRVVTTDYPWVREFEREHGARFAYIPDPGNAVANHIFFGLKLDHQLFHTPSVRAFEWPRVLAGLHVWRWLGFLPETPYDPDT